MREIKVSVVVPVYNVEKVLSVCLDSIITQTYKNIEIILIDDGSTDKSKDICDEYAKKQSNVICIHKKNEGLGKARNTGILSAHGDYVIFIDSDDYIEKNMIEEMIKSSDKGNADLITSEFIYNGIIQYSTIPEGIYRDSEIRDILLVNMMGVSNSKKNDQFNVSACTKMYKLNTIKSNHLEFFSERELIWEDMEFNFSYLQKCKEVVVKNQAYYHYNYNSNSLTHCYDKNRFVKIMRMYEYLTERVREEQINYAAMDRLALNFMGNVRTCIKIEVLHSRKNGIYNTLKNIKKICKDRNMRKLIKCVPLEKLSFQQKIFHLGVRYRLAVGLYFISVIQNMKSHGKIC